MRAVVVLCSCSFVCVGDLGGYFGLFLGGSAMSIFEILDVVMYKMFIKLKKKRRVQPSRLIQVSEVSIKMKDVKPQGE